MPTIYYICQTNIKGVPMHQAVQDGACGKKAEIIPSNLTQIMLPQELISMLSAFGRIISPGDVCHIKFDNSNTKNYGISGI